MTEHFRITFGILTVSDSCSLNPSEDKSGPTIKTLLTDTNTRSGQLLQGKIVYELCVPDEEEIIINTLKKWSDESICVILTTGGTGFSCSDITPEATKKVIEKEVTGIPLAMLMSSLKITPMAMLSRAVCGIRKKTLIINLPGSPKAVKECLEIIYCVIPHAVKLICGIETKKHPTYENSDTTTHSCHCSYESSISNIAGRLRQSPFPMVSMHEAEQIMNKIISKPGPINVELVHLEEAFQKILAETIHSLCNLPPFRASIKDGYAVIHNDNSIRKKVLCGIVAGQNPENINLTDGYCVRVNTGCPVPENATAVVQVEDTKLLKKNETTGEEIEIEIMVFPQVSQDIRPIGCDIKKNTPILEAGTKLRSIEIGILSASGCKLIPVYKTPKIGIMSTGSELQFPGEIAKTGCVYDSNRITLSLLFKENGYKTLDFGIVKDDESSMIEALKNALESVDILITTGSVSMGDRDMLKPILQNVFNASIHFGRVNMKPGKPTTFATCKFKNELKYILCLPGNPVSATVTSILFGLPLIRKLSGSNEKPVTVNAKLTFPYDLDPRPDYVRSHLLWENDDYNIPKAYSTGNQISSKLTSFRNANALLMMPSKTEEKKRMNVGDIVPALLLNFNSNALHTNF